MSYTYTTGQGIAALTPGEPLGSEQMKVAAIAIRQIKAYLRDTSQGPEARIAAAAATLTSLENSVGTSGSLPIGTIVMHGNSAVTYASAMDTLGYLFCDGRAVSRSTYSSLFGVIGVSQGPGDNLTTFNLPDYRGRVLCMADLGNGTFRMNRLDGGSALFSVGSKTGAERITLTNAQIPGHTNKHLTAHQPEYVERNTSFTGLGTANEYNEKGFDTTETVGGGQSHNNMAPTSFLPFYIKYK